MPGVHTYPSRRNRSYEARVLRAAASSRLRFSAGRLVGAPWHGEALRGAGRSTSKASMRERGLVIGLATLGSWGIVLGLAEGLRQAWAAIGG
jgi:hypothetical protein